MAAPSTEEAPSTNPLDESLKKFLSGTGKSELGEQIGYDPSASFRPAGGDVISIGGTPATGATTAEEWSHQIALENQRAQALEFEFQQRQAAEESARAAAQLAMQQAEANRQAALFGSQQEAAALANQQTSQSMKIQQAEADRAAQKQWLEYGGRTFPQYQNYIQKEVPFQSNYMAGKAVTPTSSRDFLNVVNQPGFSAASYYNPQSGRYQGPTYQAARPTYEYRPSTNQAWGAASGSYAPLGVNPLTGKGIYG